jgi:hypothetical protein
MELRTKDLVNGSRWEGETKVERGAIDKCQTLVILQYIFINITD